MRYIHVFTIGVLLFLTSCQTTEINSDYDNKIDFPSYHSFSVCLDDFQITSDKHPEYNNEKMKGLIKSAIETEMKKFYSNNDSSTELRVGVNIKVEDKDFTYRSCERQDEYHRWPECKMKTYEYTEGTLLIYVADISKQQVIWQASFTGMTREDLIENEKVINRVVKSIFEKYPLAVGKTNS